MADGYTLWDDKDCNCRLNAGKFARAVISGIIMVALSLSIITLVAGFFEYNRLKEYHSRYLDQQTAIAGLQKKLEMRKSQIESLSGKLRALETEFIELSLFERNIRDISGVEHFSGRLSLFGIGGEFPEGIDPEEIVWQQPDNLVQVIDGRISKLNDAAARRSQSLQALYEILKTQQEVLAVTPSIEPVEEGWISSCFGYRESPFTGHREYHTGVDIAIRHGSPVRATANGVIQFSGTRGNLGKLVEIDHGYGIVSRYGHLSTLLVTEKQEISKGDIIAETGNTGRSTGPHLHYEVRFNGIPMNAEMYMPQYLAENTMD